MRGQAGRKNGGRRPFRRGDRESRGGDFAPVQGEWIYGRRPVYEVLVSGRRKMFEVLLPPEGHDARDVAAIRDEVKRRGLPCRTADRDLLDQICNGGNHQGVAIRTGGFPYIACEDILEGLESRPQATILLLDHIEDPQNVGSLMRTADAAGVTAVVLPEDRSAEVTAAAVRASAGATEHLRVAKVVNLTRAMEALKEREVWITGLDMDESARPYTEIDFSGRVGLVVGSEGEGLSRLVRETCDFIAFLPMLGGVSSLNAGVAGGIAMYEIVRQRGVKR